MGFWASRTQSQTLVSIHHWRFRFHFRALYHIHREDLYRIHASNLRETGSVRAGCIRVGKGRLMWEFWCLNFSDRTGSVVAFHSNQDSKVYTLSRLLTSIYIHYAMYYSIRSQLTFKSQTISLRSDSNPSKWLTSMDESFTGADAWHCIKLWIR